MQHSHYVVQILAVSVGIGAANALLVDTIAAADNVTVEAAAAAAAVAVTVVELVATKTEDVVAIV